MRLYYAPGTCALACWISLEWAGADYTVEQVDPQSSSYRAINPLGMAPLSPPQLTQHQLTEM